MLGSIKSEEKMICMYFDTIDKNEEEEGLVEEDFNIVNVKVEKRGYNPDKSNCQGLTENNKE